MEAIGTALSILVGGTLVLGAVVVWIARLIGGGMEHNMNTCPCNACQRRRDVRFHKGWNGGMAYRVNPNSPLRDTTEVQRGWVLEIDRSFYRVKTVSMSASGYIFTVRNVETGRDSIINVKRENASHKIWRKV